MPWGVVVFFIGCGVAFLVLAGLLAVSILADRRRLAAVLRSPNQRRVDNVPSTETIDGDRAPVLSNHGGYFR